MIRIRRVCAQQREQSSCSGVYDVSGLRGLKAWPNMKACKTQRPRTQRHLSQTALEYRAVWMNVLDSPLAFADDDLPV